MQKKWLSSLVGDLFHLSLLPSLCFLFLSYVTSFSLDAQNVSLSTSPVPLVSKYTLCCAMLLLLCREQSISPPEHAGWPIRVVHLQAAFMGDTNPRFLPQGDRSFSAFWLRFLSCSFSSFLCFAIVWTETECSLPAEEVLFDEATLVHLQELVCKHPRGTDCWWECSEEELLPPCHRSKGQSIFRVIRGWACKGTLHLVFPTASPPVPLSCQPPSIAKEQIRWMCGLTVAPHGTMCCTRTVTLLGQVPFLLM
mgnify:CR=1 FL=1